MLGFTQQTDEQIDWAHHSFIFRPSVVAEEVGKPIISACFLFWNHLHRGQPSFRESVIALAEINSSEHPIEPKRYNIKRPVKIPTAPPWILIVVGNFVNAAPWFVDHSHIAVLKYSREPLVLTSLVVAEPSFSIILFNNQCLNSARLLYKHCLIGPFVPYIHHLNCAPQHTNIACLVPFLRFNHPRRQLLQ